MADHNQNGTQGVGEQMKINSDYFQVQKSCDCLSCFSCFAFESYLYLVSENSVFLYYDFVFVFDVINFFWVSNISPSISVELWLRPV